MTVEQSEAGRGLAAHLVLSWVCPVFAYYSAEWNRFGWAFFWALLGIAALVQTYRFARKLQEIEE